MLALIAAGVLRGDGLGDGSSKRDFCVNGLPPGEWQAVPAIQRQIFFLVRVECCTVRDRKSPALHRCHTAKMRRADRHRAAALSIRDSPCKSSSVLSPAWQSVCLWETCNPEQRICLVRCPLAKGSAEHACVQKKSAALRRPARSRKRRWPSGRTHLHRAASH